jgi:hypothetical protein
MRVIFREISTKRLTLPVESRPAALRACACWCIGEHQQALDACTPPDMASEHLGSINSDRLYSLHNPRHRRGRRARCRRLERRLSRPGIIGWKALVLIRLEVDDRDYDGPRQEVTVHLTAGEALALTRALTKLAESEVLDGL